MITVSIDRNQEIFVRVPLMAGKVRQNLLRTIQERTTILRSNVITNKLSGQVLNKITGHLQQSIQQEVTETPTQITGKVYSAGDVKYAAIHEYGGTIPAHVVEARNASALAFVWNGKQVFFKKVNIPTVHMPERSYLRSELEEERLAIVSAIEQAAVMGVKQ